MKHPVVHGHPLHAMTSDVPATLMPLSAVAAIAARVAPDARTRFASDASLALAIASGAGVGLLGWWDWLTMPRDHHAKRPATIHGLMNSGALLGLALAWSWRSRRAEVATATALGMLVAAWIGGMLVYTHGWRVRQARELEAIDEELDDRALGAVHDVARERVDERERATTFLPSSS